VRARAVTLFALLPASGCSLLVQFVDAPDGGDASFDAIADVHAAIVEAGVDAKPDVYDASKVCTGLENGWYCGFNGLNGSPPPDWLVDCVDGSPIVRVCDAGCLPFPSGTSDRCKECPGMPDGVYCGSQFPTYASDNASYLISCAEGLAVIQMDCTNGCTAGPGTAKCK
jgi:hypothetical protein